MTSIFHGHYLDNLRRVDAKLELQPRAKAEQAAGSEDFAKLLGQVEQGLGKEDKKANKTEPLETQVERLKSEKSSPENVLSNISAEELSPEIAPDLTSELVGKKAYGVKEVSPDTLIGPVKAQEESVKKVAVESSVDSRTDEIAALRKAAIGLSTKRPSEAHYSQDEIEQIISTAGKFHGVDPTLGLAVAQSESNFDIKAISQDGHHSKGLFQLLDSTAQDLLSRSDIDEEYDAYDPAMNSFLGVGYIRRLLDTFSQQTNLGKNLRTHPANSAAELEKIAIAAFNTGEGNVARAQARALQLGKDPAQFDSIRPHLSEITRTYVSRVEAYREALLEKESSNIKT